MQMIINGKRTEASDKAYFQDINPATGAVVDTIPSATEQDVKMAIDYAVEGQVEWAAWPLYERIAVLEKYVALVEENRDKIASAMCAENGKPIAQCHMEISGHNNIFKGYTHAAFTFYGHTLPAGAEPATVGDISFTLNEPLGVVACVVPFNYPVQIYAHKAAPALVTGNSIIVKPASDTPLATLMLVELLIQAGLPPKAAACVTGSGGKIGKWLTESPSVAAISLTGSTEVGVTLQQNGAKHLQRIFLELGGNDPLVVFGDADLPAAVAACIAGRLTNSGQICCANKRMIVHNSVKDAFTQMLINELKTKKIGDPSDPSVEVGPIINEKAAIEVEEQVNHTLKQGAKCLLGGKRSGAFYEPTVLVDVTANMDIAKDLEVFGPVFPIIGFDTFEEAVTIANNSIYGLSSGMFSQDMKTAMRFAQASQAGACYINGSGRTRMLHQPFGGYKMSGLGREGFLHTLSEMTQLKTISLYKVLS